MTTARDVIDGYVADVASRLPRRQRADIARELQGLLQEEVEARAADAQRPPDEAMARAVVTAFGRPADVAAGYRTGGILIIPPGQSSRFLASAIGGVALQWMVGIAAAIVHLNEGQPSPVVIQQWFLTWGLGALWWPGFLVLCAAASAWLRERKGSQDNEGKTIMNSNTINRAGAALLLPVALCFTIFYIAPDWFVGRLAPWMDTTWITYTSEFRSARLWAMLAYMAGNVALLAVYVWQGFESVASRQFSIAMKVTGVSVLAWCALGGPALMGIESDKVFRSILLILAMVELVDLWRRVSREMLVAR